MADTRILPKAQPRSTGIPRLTTQAAKTPNGGSAAVTTAPGVGKEIHDYVHSRGQQPPARSRMDQSQATPTSARPPAPARPAQPTPAAPMQIQAQGPAAPAQAASTAKQVFPAAPIQQRNVQRIVAGGGQPSVAQRPAVQLIDRVERGRPGTGSALQPFSIDQMMLIAHLLEKFSEGETALSGGKPSSSAEIANGALAIMSQMMNTTYAPPGAHVDVGAPQVLATSEAPRVTIVAAPSPNAQPAQATVVSPAVQPDATAAPVTGAEAGPRTT